MLVLTGCNDGLTVSESTIAEASDSRIRPKITPQMLLEIVSMPQVRREKILGIREQLAEGTYDLDERLDAVIDRILATITA